MQEAREKVGVASVGFVVRLVVAELLVCVIGQTDVYGTNAEDVVIKVSATVQESPAKITLSWPASTSTSGASIYIYRKAEDATTWGGAIAGPLDATATTIEDTSISVGTAYEYRVYQTTTLGYIYSGIKIPLVESRGKIVLVVDSTYAASLAMELVRLEEDLVGDGWEVLRHDVARAETVENVKALILADYAADPVDVKGVLLFGHVPVPYSGDMNPDGHTEHKGAWPADVFYGEMDGEWTDTTVNDTVASRDANDNIPGDGKYDQTNIPQTVELMVGRVDLANMPAFSMSEQELLRQYLNKDHAFRHKTLTAQSRALVADNFTSDSYAQNGWRFSTLVGADNVTAGDWSSLRTNDYLLAYGCGPGTYTGAGGVAVTNDYASNSHRAVFQMLFGSYFGDWDNTDNLLRAPLCDSTYGLTCCWAGRPNWFMHHMGLGLPIGYSTRLATTLYIYSTASSGGQVHIALMGDPTLRLQYVAPPPALTAVESGDNVDLSWTASSDTGILGYHVYRSADVGGPFTRLTTDLVSGTSYVDTSPLGVDCSYMVRAVRLETSASGTYYNASQGTFASHYVSGTPPAPVITTDGGKGAGIDYTTHNESLTLSGTCDSRLVSIEVNGSTDGVTYTPRRTAWSYSGTLVDGENLFSVTGTDAASVTSPEDTITITMEPPPPVPLAGLAGMAVLLGVLAASGISAIRKK